MQALLLTLARPLIEAALSAFGQVLLDLFQSWRDDENAKALGRAEANQAAAAAVEAARVRMDNVVPLSDDDMLSKLRKGDA